ncbi:hypothetical protein BGZ80_010620 [Entomortierella chlamydospora]|uniref:Uncharacterized protein n=1 Tax=Entomortierella chlamydospora TaxID=101097 RepID=A0A9P6T4F8_9FUNG|nr:hypothetical protein BGZ80_010620 [Entomortierella chlamydospora]
MGHDAMSNPYGSYMPAANQLGNFGMGPIASLPNDYAALYGNDIQRAMYYDPNSYGQMPVTGANSYQTRDNKYTQDSSAAVSTTGAASAGATQAQQTLQQQQQQQAYPNMAGGMPYYPYYYMQHQFPNAYQQSGYGQPFMGKNMYPMYQQQHSNKPGSANSSPYSNYGAAGAGQGSHHQYSQSGYDDMSGAGLHGMGGLGNDPYAKYNSPGMQSFLGGQQQVATPTTNAGNGKTNVGSNSYGGAEKTTGTGSQSSNVAGGASLQGQQGVGVNQMQQAYYQQQMFSSYQYPNHHQGYHPSQHQGQHQGSGRNNNNSNQQFCISEFFCLLLPFGDNSPIQGFLNKSGGIHQVCIEVDDVIKAVNDLLAKNIKAFCPYPRNRCSRQASRLFLHPKDCHGTLVELELS